MGAQRDEKKNSIRAPKNPITSLPPLSPAVTTTRSKRSHLPVPARCLWWTGATRTWLWPVCSRTRSRRGGSRSAAVAWSPGGWLWRATADRNWCTSYRVRSASAKSGKTARTGTTAREWWPTSRSSGSAGSKASRMARTADESNRISIKKK